MKMSELYVPVSYGDYPEDGETICENAFESKEEANARGKEMSEGEYGQCNYFLKTVEVVPDE